MKLVLFTGCSLQHKYIADILSENFELELIVSELGPVPPREVFATEEAEDAAFIEAHYQKALEREQEFFGAYSDFPEGVPQLELPQGELDSEEISELVESIAPDYLILFGSSLLRSPLLDSYRSRIVALQPGLSPYYTGTAPHMFPYFHQEPECIGASMQLVTVKEDEGEILHQLRPEMSPDDDLHRIYQKVVHKAGKHLPGVLRGFASKNITPQPQMPAGRIGMPEDLTAGLLREIYSKFEQGMLKEYLEDKEHRDAAQRIVDADLQLE